MPQTQPQAPAPEPRETPAVPLPTQAEAGPAESPITTPAAEASAPAEAPPAKPKAPSPRKSSSGRGRAARGGTAAPRKGAAAKKRKRRKTSPIPASMWLLPRFRLPFSTPRGFLRWFLTGINFWAVAAVVLCALGGYQLVGALTQPRVIGVEQALAGGEATGGLTYTVARTGDGEATVTGTWDPEAGEEAPGPELAAALCAALSPEEIYGHSDHLYRAIASRFFEGKDFALTIVLREAERQEDGEEPEEVFSVTRGAGAEDWAEPECADAFARQWREVYNGYWLFGQGRKEEMGPPQSDPIIEVGDLPPEGPPGGEEEEAPPLPDFGEEEPEESAGPEAEGDVSLPAESSEPEGDVAGEAGETEEAEVLERFFRWVLEQAKKYRERGFAEG